MSDSTTLRICRKCKLAIPPTSEYFNADKRVKIGIKSICKKCEAEYNREYKQRPIYKEYERNRNNRADVKARRKEQGIEYRQRPESKAKRLEYWRRPEVKARDAERKKQPEYKAQRQRQNQRYDPSPEAIAKRREYQREYRQRPEYKLYRNLNNRKRRAGLKDGTVTAGDVQLQLKSQKWRCWHCGKKIVGNNYHVDHLIPLARGGKHDPRNIVISCPRCNESKNSKLCYEWNGRLF